VSLTIGDGLVSQFPSLLVSTATGLIVTRAVSDGSFGNDLTKQFGRQDRVYWIAAIFLTVLAFLPGFPWYVLLPLAAMSGVMAYRLGRRRSEREQAAEQASAKKSSAPAADQSQEFPKVAPLDPISLELGYGLVPLVDKEQGAELLERITKIRRETALDLGLIVPRIRIIDNMRLEPSEYCLKIRGVEVGRGVLRMGSYLCINPGSVSEEIEGEKTTDPAFGLPALWIGEGDRDRAERAGYTVVDPPSIIATHLTELIKKNAANILGRQEVKGLLDGLREDYSAVVEEVQGLLGIGDIQKVLQGLLGEQVSIRNMVTILESLADYAKIAKDDIPYLIEKVRQGLGRQICLQYTDEDRVIHVITLEPALEQMIIESRQQSAAGVAPALQPETHRRWINATMNTVRGIQERGYLPIILTQEVTRPLVKAGTRRDIPDLVVLSVPEIIPEVNIESLGVISIQES
jgi:flagellar biosynthesis protein FlhA